MGQANPETKELLKPRFRSLGALDRYRNLCLWLPVNVISPTVPWGYKRDPNNSKVALPDEKGLVCFIKAKEYLKSHSYQIVAEWLGTCGFPISDDGLIKLWSDRPYWPEIYLPYEERLKL